MSFDPHGHELGDTRVFFIAERLAAELRPGARGELGRDRLGERRAAGDDRDVLMLDDIPGGLEPFGRRGDVVGEGAIPSLDERDGPDSSPSRRGCGRRPQPGLRGPSSSGCRRSTPTPKNEVFKSPASAV